MSPLAFAWRSLVRQPARAALGVLGVAAVGALLFDMLLLSRGLVISFSDLLDTMGYDVRVTATRDLPGVGPPIADTRDTVARLRRLPEVEQVLPLSFDGAEALTPEGPRSLTFIGTDPVARARWEIVEGEDLGATAPREPPPILINRNLSRVLDAGVGERIRVRANARASDALPAVEFRVLGIADFPFDTPGELTAATTLSAFRQARGTSADDEADMLLVASDERSGAEAAVAAIRAARPDYHAFSNDQLIARFRMTNFSYFRQISFVLSSVTLFFAFILVTSLLTVSVNQRLAEIAALRALGFDRLRIVADVVAESALLVGAGGLLALPLGALIAVWLESILGGMPGVPEKAQFFVFEMRAVGLHAALLTVAGLLAALYPVVLAARLPIASTLRREVVS